MGKHVMINAYSEKTRKAVERAKKSHGLDRQHSGLSPWQSQVHQKILVCEQQRIEQALTSAHVLEKN